MTFFIKHQHLVVTVDCSPEEDMCEQKHKKACDIHTIMGQMERTGAISHLAQAAARFGDFTDVPDYHTAMNIVAQANSMFELVPSSIRDMFKNDPGAFLDFVQDPANAQKLVDLDLAHIRTPELSLADSLKAALAETPITIANPEEGGVTPPPDAGVKQGRRPR